jgi:large subunit ribosomal protein L4
MELQLTVSGKTDGKAINLADTIFAQRFNEALVHQVVTAYMAGGRAGTKAQKTRAEVSGGGIKPWKQKGTGRARAGTIRSPLWRKGGVTFAAKPRDFSQKVNRKMYQGALRSILSSLVKENRLILVEDLQVANPKTKELVKKLTDLQVQSGLVVTDKIESNLQLAARNLPHVSICRVTDINPVNLLSFEKIILTLPAVKKIEEWLA